MADRQTANFDETIAIRVDEKLISPSARKGLLAVKPLNVTTLQRSARAAFTALRVFAERPELLIATSRSPLRACISICYAKTQL